MKPQPEIGDTQLSVEENKLAELERQKSIIETEEHRGFGNAIHLIQHCCDVRPGESDQVIRICQSLRQQKRL
jgi:hypothetical protein